MSLHVFLRKGWFCFCNKRKTSAFQTTLSTVRFTEMFDTGIGYSALNTACSALSVVGIVIEGFSVGSHPVVVRFMKGIYNQRPSVPTYSEFWDVSIVLKYLQKLLPVESLSLKLLTLKLAMLISLTLACRTQSIHALDIRNMIKTKDSYILIVQ